MARLSKRMRNLREKVDAGRIYPFDEAFALLGEGDPCRFKQSIDVAVRLGVDTRKSDQAVRGSVALTHGNGRTTRVAVFADGDEAREAEEAGADIVGMEELAEKIRGGFLEFDVSVATPKAMRLVGQLGQILGPRGLMPNPKTGTVTKEVGQAVTSLKAGRFMYRADKNGIIHGSIGRVGFSASAVRENLQALLAELRRAKPPSAKGQYLRKLTLSTTMGPGIDIDLASLAGP